jgi:serine/threonine protein kinase
MFSAESPIRCKAESLFLNASLCVLCAIVYLIHHLDCPGGELFYYLKSVKRMTEDQARFYFIEIMYGLMYLHQQNIIYRDLKP